jgi:hypothetical protein
MKHHMLSLANQNHNNKQQPAKTSPDTYVQLALQLAWRRLHGGSGSSSAAVSETCSMRGFFHGRTETCRSVSMASDKFVALFDDDDVLYGEVFV